MSLNGMPPPRVIHLKPEEAERLPCGSTKVPWGRTKGEIDGLLYDYDVKHFQWTTWEETDVLVFDIELEIQGVKRRLAFQFVVPRIYVKHRVSKNHTWTFVDEYAKDSSWRMFYWHVKSKLEAVRYGIAGAEVEMMAEIIHRLPDGTQTTLGDTIPRVIAEDRLDKLALPAPERRVVEVEAVVKGEEAHEQPAD